MFFNSRNKVEINNIKNLCISHVIKIINTFFFKIIIIIIIMNTCYFYKLSLMKFFQSSLKETLSIIIMNLS
jgi:hypothetical protein